MKKVIAAFDGLKYSRCTEQQAIDIAVRNGIHLVGVFLDDFTYHSYKVYDVVNAGLSDDVINDLNERDEEQRRNSVRQFEKACHEAHLNYTVHRDRNIALQDLLHETIYSDLLIINPAETFTHYNKPMPTEFIRDLLSMVQCPVLLTTTVFRPLDKLYFLYDGEPSSVYAVKMFSYVLSVYKDIPAEVITVKKGKENSHLPDNRLMKEFMKRHFPKAAYTLLKGDPEEEVVNYLADQRSNGLVVLGAYQRNLISRWFRHSMADHLIKELRLPLFIAHQK